MFDVANAVYLHDEAGAWFDLVNRVTHAMVANEVSIRVKYCAIRRQIDNVQGTRCYNGVERDRD